MSVFIIAEVGVNHNGRWDIASLLASKANLAGANAVKFQYFSSQRLWGDDRIKHLELRQEDFVRLKRDCDSYGIEFMCTPFGIQELHEMQPMLKRLKIASGFVRDSAMLEAARETGLPVILSTGMSSYSDVEIASDILSGADVTLLHCTSAYPCPLQDVNLLAMEELRRLGHPVGYSDHTEGTIIALAAVAAGAVVIEKHLTLDRSQEGPDHEASIEPESFADMVREIRQLEIALGDGDKRIMPSEEACAKAWHDRR